MRNYEKYSGGQETEDKHQLLSAHFMREQKFLAYTVAANGVHLWKSMMHDRYRWIKAKGDQTRTFGDLGPIEDQEMDRLIKGYLSRKLSYEDKEQRKLLKSI